MNSFHKEVGSNPRTEPQPDQAPVRESDVPGDFVSDDLRADCARFIDDVRTLVERRAAPPPGSPGWLPGRLY
jgi:hypothetical protein